MRYWAKMRYCGNERWDTDLRWGTDVKCRNTFPWSTPTLILRDSRAGYFLSSLQWVQSSSWVLLRQIRRSLEKGSLWSHLVLSGTSSILWSHPVLSGTSSVLTLLARRNTSPTSSSTISCISMEIPLSVSMETSFSVSMETFLSLPTALFRRQSWQSASCL